MTSNTGDSDDHRPDLNKHPGDAEAKQAYASPVNPYPAQQTYPTSPSDQFLPYTPPQYGDPLETQYPSQQYPTGQYPTGQYPTPQYTPPQYPTPQYSPPQYSPPHYPTVESSIPQYPATQYPMPHYPMPGYPPSGPPPVQLQPAAVAATRALGAVAMVGALLFIAYGWLTWASFTPKYTDAETASVNGWGQVFQDGSQIITDPGATGTPYAAIFIPFFVLPVVILALLIMCNIGRFGNSIAILILSVLHLFAALAFLTEPSTCIIFDIADDMTLFEGLNNFSTGPGTIMATVTLVVMIGTSLAGIVLGRKKIYASPQTNLGYGGYPGY